MIAVVPMQIALTVFRYFPHGGMQRDLLATARGAQQRGHDVRVLCHTWQGPRPAGLAIEELPAAGRSNHKRAASFAAAAETHLQQQERPDIVVGFDKMPGLDWYFAADPCYVARTQDRPWPYRWTSRYRTFRALEAAVFAPESATRILLLADRTGQDYRQVWQTPAERFVTLPPGIARDRCRGSSVDATARRDRVRRSLDIKDDEYLLLALASNPMLKGVDRALEAMAHLPASLARRTRMLAVGAQANPRLQSLAKQRSVEDRFRMVAGRDDVPDLLQAADLLVHLARRDTTGTVLLEALVAGLPALCTDACGYAHHIAAAGAAAGSVLGEPYDREAAVAALARSLRIPRQETIAASERYRNEHDLHALHEQLLDTIGG